MDGNEQRCAFDPILNVDRKPVGMFHCPDCGQMVVAGVPHPDYSILDNLTNEEVSENERY